MRRFKKILVSWWRWMKDGLLFPKEVNNVQPGRKNKWISALICPKIIAAKDFLNVPFVAVTKRG